MTDDSVIDDVAFDFELLRELTETDAEALAGVHELAARGASWRTLVHALVRSDPFQAVGPQVSDEEAP